MKFLKTGPVKAQGHLLFDPELRFTPSGKAVSNFQITTLDGTILECTAWESLAEEMAEHGVRQKPITIQGKWATRHWTDREEMDHTINYVLVESFEWGL